VLDKVCSLAFPSLRFATERVIHGSYTASYCGFPRQGCTFIPNPTQPSHQKSLWFHGCLAYVPYRGTGSLVLSCGLAPSQRGFVALPCAVFPTSQLYRYSGLIFSRGTNSLPGDLFCHTFGSPFLLRIGPPPFTSSSSPTRPSPSRWPTKEPVVLTEGTYQPMRGTSPETNH
jgi:hypothetical protein